MRAFFSITACAIATAVSAAVDSDGDLLTDDQESLLATDSLQIDTDADGINDFLETAYATDPLTPDWPDIQRLSDQWTDFSTGDGFMPGLLSGQQGWLASSDLLVDAGSTVQFPASSAADQYAFTYFESGVARQVWVSFTAHLARGALLDPAADDFDVTGQSAVFQPNPQGFLSAYDGTLGAWVTFDTHVLHPAEDSEAEDTYLIALNFDFKTWDLIVNGAVVSLNIPFADPGSEFFSMFSMSREASDLEALPAWLSELSVSYAEPAWLDYDDDGLSNADERNRGTLVNSADTDGDTIDDLTEVALGLNPTSAADALDDLDQDGLSNLDELELGSQIHIADTDGDGVDDGDEYLARTDLTDSASAPTRFSLTPFVQSDVGLPAASKLFGVEDRNIFAAYGSAPNGKSDAVGYHSLELTGSFEVSVQINDLIGLDSDSKFGIMVRDSLAESSRTLAFYVSGRERYSWFVRASEDEWGQTRNYSHISRQYGDFWVRLVGHNSYFSGYISKNGTAWEQLFEETYLPSETYHVGLVLDPKSDDVWQAVSFGVAPIELDSDSDGLSDELEAELGTDDRSVDTDGDGVDDFTEIEILSSDALAADFGALMERAVQVETARPNVSNGTWSVTDGEAIVSRSLNGDLSYTVEIPDDGVYRLTVAGGQDNSLSDDNLFSIRVLLNGLEVGQGTIVGAYGETGSVTMFLPYTAAGLHNLTIDWLNGEENTFLRIDDLYLDTYEGEDNDGDGIVDWMSAFYRDAFWFDPSERFSVYSPLSVFGGATDPSQVTLFAGADGAAMSSVAVESGLKGQFFASVPLVGSVTEVEVAHPGLSLTETTRVHWLTLDVFDQTALTVPAGSTIRVGHELENPDQPVDVSIEIRRADTLEVIDSFVFEQGSNFVEVVLPNETVALKFTALAGANGAEVHQNEFDVAVVKPDLGPDLAALVGLPRPLEIPDLPEGVTLAADPSVSIRREGNSFSLTLDESGQRSVVARLGASGDILDVMRAQGMRDFTLSTNRHDTVQVFPDGSVMVRATVRIEDLADSVTVFLDIFKSGVFFDDGTTERTVTAADFNQYGEYNYYMIMEPWRTGGYCHRIEIRDVDTRLARF